MVFFSCLQLLLSHMFINEGSGSEEGCPHHFMLRIRPLKLHPSLCLFLYSYYFPHSLPLHIHLSHDLNPTLCCVPLLIPLLHLHVFPHIRPLKLHPYLCLLISPSSCPRCFPLRLPISNNLHPPIPLPLPHKNHRSQIIQCLAALMPLFCVSLL